jgi:hypothetical protein
MIALHVFHVTDRPNRTKNNSPKDKSHNSDKHRGPEGVPLEGVITVISYEEPGWRGIVFLKKL